MGEQVRDSQRRGVPAGVRRRGGRRRLQDGAQGDLQQRRGAQLQADRWRAGESMSKYSTYKIRYDKMLYVSM